MLRKVASVYSIVVGISVLGLWSMIILTDGIAEGPIEISFHLTSEFLMAILLIISGIGLLIGKTYGKKVFLISNGMLVYSVLNAAGGADHPSHNKAVSARACMVCVPDLVPERRIPAARHTDSLGASTREKG